MASTIVTKNSSTASAVPVTGDLTQGELAVNVTDKRLFTKNSGGTVVELGTNPASLALPNGTANGVAYLNGSKVVTTGSALTFDGTNLSTTGRVIVSGGAGISDVSLGTYSGGAWLNTPSGSTAYLAVGGSNAFRWDASSLVSYIGGSEQMRLTSTGLGIGTSSPAYKLDVSRGSSGIVAKFTGTASAYVYAGSQDVYFTSDTSANNAFGANSTSNYLNFYTNGSERMRLDSSGNLGLGVTPSAWQSDSKALDIGAYTSLSNVLGYQATISNNAYYNAGYKYRTSGYVASAFAQANGAFYWQQTSTSGTAGNAITFTQAMTLTAAGRLGLGLTSPSTLFEAYGGAAGTSSELTVGNASTAARFGVDTSNEVTVATGQAVPIKFLTSNTERARITSGGYFKASNNGTYLGSTASYHEFASNVSNSTLWITNSNATPYGFAATYTSVSPNNTTSEFIACADTLAQRATIRSNGGLANYSANNVNLSDQREKTNFAPAGDYLSKICAIPVQTFNYIDQNLEDDPGTTLGVVAQDVQAIAPELVVESNWGTEDAPKMRLSIYQTDLQYALMKALQELKAEFDAYKATHP